MNQILFQKYLDGDCTADERKLVEEWICIADTEKWDALLLERWNYSGELMPEAQSRSLWNAIRKKISPPRILAVVPAAKWLAAACVSGLLLYCFQVFVHHTPVLDPVTVRQQMQPVRTGADWTQVVNRGEKQLESLLPDGSKVLLHPGAKIAYPADYNRYERTVKLEGKSIFYVAKNPHKPFTVYSGSVTTMALGTSFLIDCRNRNEVDVKLFTGLVRVKLFSADRKELSSRLLRPGETIHVAGSTMYAKKDPVHKGAQAQHLSGHRPVLHTAQVDFANTPLNEALDTIGVLFHIKIEWDRSILDGMSLTTSVHIHDSPSSLLALIAKINGLEIRQEDGVYKIQQKKTVPEHP